MVEYLLQKLAQVVHLGIPVEMLQYANIDADGTTNLDTVDIDGNVQVDGTVTVGVNDTGHDVKFFEHFWSVHQFDASADKLLTAGGATVDVVKTVAYRWEHSNNNRC